MNDDKMQQFDSPGACNTASRREFLRLGLGFATAGSAGILLSACATDGAGRIEPAVHGGDFERAAGPALAGLQALAALDAQNGGAAPSAIPWLDKNGSFNQAPGPRQDPSNIFHFKGRIARANGYTGMGTDNKGRRIPFGTNTTDFSFMVGEYWAGRSERQGTFAHT